MPRLTCMGWIFSVLPAAEERGSDISPVNMSRCLHSPASEQAVTTRASHASSYYEPRIADRFQLYLLEIVGPWLQRRADWWPIADNHAFSQITNTFNPSQSYGVSDFDVTHLVTGDWTYQLPFGRGKAFGCGFELACQWSYRRLAVRRTWRDGPADFLSVLRLPVERSLPW